MQGSVSQRASIVKCRHIELFRRLHGGRCNCWWTKAKYSIESIVQAFRIADWVYDVVLVSAVYKCVRVPRIGCHVCIGFGDGDI